MNAVVCNNIQCKYNGGKFCNKPILIVYGGVCGELVDTQGRQKDPQSWMKNAQNESPIMTEEEWKSQFQ